MKPEEKIFVRKYKGIDIYFNPREREFMAEHPKTGEGFRGNYNFEIEKDIDNSFWEECDELGIIKAWSALQKVKATRKNKKTKEAQYEIIETTKSYNSDVGKVVEDDTKIYPATEENLRIYTRVQTLEREIDDLESERDAEMELLK